MDASGGGITAQTISINPEILDDSNKIASGKINIPASLKVSDNEVALAIASLGRGLSQEILDTYFGGQNPLNGADSIGNYYGAIIAELGVDVQKARKE